MMALYSDVTRESVLAAVKECDEKGRKQFLADRGYGGAQTYFLALNGKYYDSKAILLTACAYEHGDSEPLPYNAFSGGSATVVRYLRQLGFTVSVRHKTRRSSGRKKSKAPGKPSTRRAPPASAQAAGKRMRGSQARRQHENEVLTWSEWVGLEQVRQRQDPLLDLAGVYRIRVVDAAGQPIVQHRFMGTDKNGVVYIGQTVNPLRRRLSNIPRGRRTGKTSHTLGRKLHVLDSIPGIHKRLEKLSFECQVAHSRHSKEAEKRLLQDYVATYGEVPPLNGTFPDRGDREAWAGYVG